MARFWSSQTWVMPTFSPTIALLATSLFFLPAPFAVSRAHANAPPGRPERSARLVRREVPARPAITHVCCGRQHRSAALFASELPGWAARQVTPSARPPARHPAGTRGDRPSGRLYLDLDVHAGRQVEPLERVDRLGRVLDDVDQTLVDPHLEVLARVLVLVGRPDHRVAVLVGRQRDRPEHLGLGPEHRLHDLLRRLVQDLVVVGLQPDSNLLLRAVGHYLRISSTTPEATVRPPSRMAKRRPLSMAIGLPSSTVILVLSPGMTISVPSGSVMVPVTSVVRK